ncbi:hypothetical protein [Vibrio owensii]|uniref:hypothetical protein n=1 Tax=Vibrio harveyi group TaxID=717610 RepID=UPI003CC57419
MATTKTEFKNQIRTLQSNLTVTQMAQAIGQAARDKSLSEEILSRVSDKVAHKTMDFSRCAELLSKATFNKSWNEVSASLTENDIATCEAVKSTEHDSYSSHSARELHQDMLGQIEYHNNVYVVGSNGLTFTEREDDLLEVSEQLFFETDEIEDSVSGYFDITVNVRTGELINWCTGCSQIENIVKDADSLDLMVGELYKGVIRDFSPKTYIAFQKIDKGVTPQYLLLKVFSTSELSVDDFWDSIGDNFQGVTVAKKEEIRGKFAWDNSLDLPYMQLSGDGEKPIIFNIC